MANISEIAAYCDRLLNCGAFHDVSLNGLQVAGGLSERFGAAVTASLDAIRSAEECGCKLLLVHHGIIWKGSQSPCAGPAKARLKALFGADVTLLACHLPLDAQRDFGNNASLLRAVGASGCDYLTPGDPASVGMRGVLEIPSKVSELAALLSAYLDCKARYTIDSTVSKIAVCSGSGSFMLEDPAFSDELLITGEMSEQAWHLAAEMRIPVIVLGHDPSEQLGIWNLAGKVEEQFSIERVPLFSDPEGEASEADCRGQGQGSFITLQ